MPTTLSQDALREVRKNQSERKLSARAALRHTALENDGERQRWFSHVQEVIRYARPDLCEELEVIDHAGEKRGQYMYTAKPLTDLEKAADGFVGNVFQESGWFAPVMDQEELNEVDALQRWLQLDEKIMLASYRNSHFVTMQPPIIMDSFSLGDGLTYTQRDPETGLITYRKCRILAAYLKRDLLGRLKVVHYLEPYFACEAYERWGEKLGPATVRAAFTEPFSAVNIVRCVYRRGDPILDGITLAKDRPYVELLFEKGSPYNYDEDPDHGILEQEGYFENPFSSYAYWLEPGESYGRSPYMSALLSIKRQHADHKAMMNSSQRAAASPLQGPEALRGKIDLRPDAYNALPNPTDQVRPIYGQVNYPYGVDYLERMEGQLEDVLHLPLYQAMSMTKKEMTVPEVLERIGEMQRIMAPRVGSYQLYLDTIHDRTWQLLSQMGRLPPPPQPWRDLMYQGIVSGKINMRYKGPLAQTGELLFMQRRLTMALNMLGALGQFDPDAVKDRMKVDVLAEQVMDEGGLSQEAIADDREVRAKQDIRGRLRLAQAQAEIAQGQTQAQKNLALSHSAIAREKVE